MKQSSSKNDEMGNDANNQTSCNHSKMIILLLLHQDKASNCMQFTYNLKCIILLKHTTWKRNEMHVSFLCSVQCIWQHMTKCKYYAQIPTGIKQMIISLISWCSSRMKSQLRAKALKLVSVPLLWSDACCVRGGRSGQAASVTWSYIWPTGWAVSTAEVPIML